jgi:hypothetical protein
MEYSKFLVELNYNTSQNELHIFRTDKFFFPCYNEHETEKTIKYLSRFMRKHNSECTIEIKTISVDGLDRNGIGKFKYSKYIFFNVMDDAVTVKWWMDKYEEYSSGSAMSPDKAIEKLKESLEVW